MILYMKNTKLDLQQKFPRALKKKCLTVFPHLYISNNFYADIVCQRISTTKKRVFVLKLLFFFLGENTIRHDQGCICLIDIIMKNDSFKSL